MTNKFPMYYFRQIVVVLSLLAGGATVNAACPSWATATRFLLNGAEVLDQRTGLTWARCSVGQSWNGSNCIGPALQMNHEAAFDYVKSQVGWRLPSDRELFSLADKGCYNPAIDIIAFPDTPSGAFWSSTPKMNLQSSGIVAFLDGTATMRSRYESYFIRLLRANF
jgi:hypothetical protein